MGNKKWEGKAQRPRTKNIDARNERKFFSVDGSFFQLNNMSRGSYSKKNGSRLNRITLSKIFGKKNRRPNAECWELENFLRDTLAGCDVGLLSGRFYIEHAGDVYAFNHTTGVTPAVWQKWLADRPTSKFWPVVEKQGDDYVWTWFTRNRKMGAWVPVGEDCPVLYKLAKRHDGKGVNKVPVGNTIDKLMLAVAQDCIDDNRTEERDFTTEECARYKKLDVTGEFWGGYAYLDENENEEVSGFIRLYSPWGSAKFLFFYKNGELEYDHA